MPLSLTLYYCYYYYYNYYSHYTGEPALDSTPNWELEDFIPAKFYCLPALAYGN